METTTNAPGRRARACGPLVLLALTAIPGRAVAQATVEDLTTPTSTVEVGAGVITDGSYKAGEYNGLASQGGFAIAPFDWRGGGRFDSDNALRWRVRGADLGLETRNVSAEIGAQGKFRLSFVYDELRRNRSDSFQTPYLGTGSATFTLPATWLVPTVAGSSTTNTAVNTVSARGLVKAIGDAPYISTTNSTTQGGLLTPTPEQTARVDTASNADLPLFDNFNIHTKRTRIDLGVDYDFGSQWGIAASFTPEHKDGDKPMGTVSRNTGGDIAAIIPDPIDANHDRVNVSLDFKGRRSFAEAGYYGSFFRNNISSVSWQNWATGPTATGLPGTVNTMSSAPDNNFNQFNLTGVYSFSSTSKLVGTGSYARNTQNDTFLSDSTTPVVPIPSLNGLVVNWAFNARFTSRPAKHLNLAAGYKYNDRDNRTPVNIYQYSDAGEATGANVNFPASSTNPYGAVVAQNANANRPYSRSLHQVNLDADYAVASGQWIKVGYDFERVAQKCNGSWISCADADTTNENALRAEWRTTVAEYLTARIGYVRSWRRAPNYNENAFLALVPYASVSPATATGGATALSFMTANGWNGWGPALGYATTTGNMQLFFPSNNALANATYANNNRISELPGMRRYYVADRDRDKVRAYLTWQANDRLSVQGGMDLNKDDYPTAVYGLQDAKGWAVDLDGSYAITNDWGVDVFYTYEHQRSISAGNTYTANSNTATITNGQPGAVGLSGNSCDTYTTLQQRNNNNKLDPCLNWSADALDKVNTVGLAVRAMNLSRLNLTGHLVFSRARWDDTYSGGNWANNILNGPGGPPTTIAAYFIAATPLPTVTTDTTELRLTGRFRLDRRQAVRVDYSYLRMRSDDPAYGGMEIGEGTLSGVLPSSEQAFNYSVNVFGVSYILAF